METPAPVETPVVEATPAPVVDAPVVEAPVGTPQVVEPVEEAVDWTNAEQQTRAAEALARVEKYGSPEEVEQAIAIRKALQTEEGITALFEKAGAALGIPAEKLAALFGAGEPLVEAEDEDRVLTYREFKEQMEKQVTAPLAQREAAAQQAAATATVNGILGELGVTDDAEVRAVLAAGQKFIADGDFDPEHIKTAVRKGYAEYERAAKARFVKYVADKVKDGKELPGSIGAGSPGGVTLTEPQTVEEGIKRARARLISG